MIGLMAYPIRHSSSPAMHNEAFATLGLGRLISLPFASPLSDKLGRHFSVIIGCASYVVFLVGIATMGIKLFISVAQLLMPFFLGVAAGTMVALFVTSALITKFKQVRFLVIYPAISLIMLALVYMIKTPMICYIGAFVLGYAAAGGVLQMAIVMNIVITAIGVLLALFVNLRYDVLLKNTENQ